ncbi:acyl-CoA dehydrogenase family protein [Blastococcus sp. SYSU D00669]
MTGAGQEELAELVSVARAVATGRIAPLLAGLEVADRLDPGLVGHLSAAGLWSLGMPEDVGGQGADAVTTLRVVRELAQVSPSVALAVVHAHAAVHALLAVGETATAADVAAGSTAVVGFGDVDPADDDVLVVPRLDLGVGAGPLLLFDPGADALVLTAAENPAQPVRRCGLPGLGTTVLRVRRAELRAGLRGSWCGRAHREALATAAAWWTGGTTVAAIGAAIGATEHASAYVRSRHQFGAPLVEIPTVAGAVAHARSELCTASATALRYHRRTGSVDAHLARRAVNLAVRTCIEAVQLFGGYGYLREYLVEGLLRDAVSLRAAQAAPARTLVASRTRPVPA